MRQLEPLVIEDREGVVYHVRSGRRPYLVVLPLLLLGGAIALAGALGPRPPSARALSPTGSSVAAGSSASTSLLTPSTSPTPSAAYSPTEPPVPWMDNVTVASGDITERWLGWDAEVVGVAGSEVVFRSEEQLWTVNTASQYDQNRASLLEAPPCGLIVGAAAASDRVIWAEAIEPGTADADTTQCTGALTSELRVMLLDLSDFHRRQLTTGRLDEWAAGSTEEAVHLAISDSRYALTRPGTQPGETALEVRALADNRLLFSTVTQERIRQLLLADTRLVVLTMQNDDALVGRTDALRVSVSTEKSPDLALAGWALGEASMSPDGRIAFVSCDTQGWCGTVRVVDEIGFGDMPAGYVAGSVAIGGSGNGTVAWNAHASGRDGYIVIVNDRWPDGVALVGIPEPVKVILHEDFLYWISPDANGAVYLRMVHLKATHLQP
jgi:hypothetical protein